MNRTADFKQFRETYPEFHYHNYTIHETPEAVELEFYFEIPGLAEFHPQLRLKKKNLSLKSLDSTVVENLVFHIGLIELISYWKSSCAPRVIIHCGRLDADQIAWWKKLYFYGLGELFYTNGIMADIKSFMEISCADNAPRLEYSEITDPSEGYITLIGGGKDSIVTLETLPLDHERDYCMIVNPKSVTRTCAELAGFDDAHVIEISRTIDSELLRLNKDGFINGHTPFSTMLAFVSYFVAFLTGRKYIAVSNESSANESNVCDLKVNHQYSKSFEFEQDFDHYAAEYLKAPVQYFSFLRPLNELQIAKIFARLEKYHSVFKSCNVGSKGETWVWCGHCAKCLFAFIILAPYLYPEKLVPIFGKDLFTDETLLKTFKELCGKGANKPFDCVGTFEEVNFAISQTIENLQTAGKKLPFLLSWYAENCELVDTNEDLTARYNLENNLAPEQNAALRAEVFRNV